MIDLAVLTATRVHDPGAILRAWAARRPGRIPPDGRLLIVAADHPARGALAVRDRRDALASRSDLLSRLADALRRPGVDGVLGTADILDDLLLLGLLDDKLVFGSMNRGGLQGAAFELDDRFTAHDVESVVAQGLDGAKMPTRSCFDDPGSVATLAACGLAITQLAAAGKLAMVEPFLTVRTAPDRVANLLDPDSVIRSIHIASGLGATSSHTWLKLPVVDDMPRVLDATTLPTLLLGGDPTDRPDEAYAAWGAALACPPAAGLVVGRALLHPHDGDVPAAVDIAAALVHPGVS